MGALFCDKDNREYGIEDIRSALLAIGADQCSTLFIHSDVMFGKLAAGVKRNGYLAALSEALKSLGVRNIIVPTFTYSFCNGEVYDVLKSKTSMGVLNEYIRSEEGRLRTHDPLLSLSVPQSLKERFCSISNHSLGENSGLDILHRMEDVKFLFFGARMGNCFTYVHYVEKMMDVPYRFDMPFEGIITDEGGSSRSLTQYIHTACFGVKPADFYYFEDELEDKGSLRKTRLGDKSIACIDEKTAYNAIKDKISGNINYFLEQPFTEKDLEKRYTKGLDGERITHC